MVQIVIVLAIFMILVIPMGKYLYHIATNQKTFGDRLFDKVDNFIYKVCSIDKKKEM
ncbi:MAG: potassium-transporting ATPase subunit KdpA, partial [Clostridioides difficile]|nr:potassium-transporting ATPase subunit KdpA [Clostridioides difficile]